MQSWRAFIIIILFSLIGLSSLLKPGFTGYDFIYQGARLAAFYRNLQEGVILPRWAGGPINADYGHPVLIFLYPFVFYLASFWYWLGFSLVNSLKILFALSYILSGIFTYLLFKKLTSSKIALLIALFYLFIPYRFLNLYNRAALGEHLAVSFLPLIFLGIKERKPLFLALATALTILSHNLIFILASPLIIIFLLYLFFKNKKSISFIFSSILGLSWALFLTAFFWFPLIFERRYLRYDEIANPDYFWHNGILPLHQIFFPPEYHLWQFNEPPFGNLMYASISPTQWFLFVLGLFFIFKFWQKNKKESLFILLLNLYFLTGALLATKSMFWLVNAFPQLALVQQAYRFLNLPLLASPFLVWIIIKVWFKEKFLFLIFFIFIHLLLSLPYFWNLKLPYQFKDDRYFFEEYQETADTGQITPRWALINYLKPAKEKIQLVAGGLDKVEIKKWTSQEHVYFLTLRENSQIADNTLYFPGWTVFVDGQKVPINFQDMNWRGIITYPVPQGRHEVKVKFEETKIRLLGDILSLLSFFLLFFVFLFKLIKQKKLKIINKVIK